jgi:hypothetical protein
MHFCAKWDVDYDLKADDSDSTVTDILFLETKGRGRIVGTSVLLYNPSEVPTSWGNWWGEGDEKIFIDRDTFPSFFGTGTEDYFNYSWSSSSVFSYPFCGQPRNDGPGNRGYVTNFRWHISDDIPFREKIRFFIELRHHGYVNDFIYARTVYYYSLPDNRDASGRPDLEGIRNIEYNSWLPVPFKGSSGWRFVQAEQIVRHGPGITAEKDSICAGKLKISWIPLDLKEKLILIIDSDRDLPETRIGLTFKHSSSACSLSFKLNGNPLNFDNSNVLNLRTTGSQYLANHFSSITRLKKGKNELMLEMIDPDGKNRADLDFVWLRVK